MKFKLLDVPASIYFFEASNNDAKVDTNTKHKTSIEMRLRERSNQVLSWMQPGLIYPAPWQCALALFNVPESLCRKDFARIVSEARLEIHSNFGSKHASVSIAFSFDLWMRYCEAESRPLPSGMSFSETASSRFRPSVLERSGGMLQDSGANVWFIIKADTEAASLGLTDYLVHKLNTLGISKDDIYNIVMHSRDNPALPMGKPGGRVLGGRFQENLRNPSSPVEFLEHILIGGEDQHATGGTFIFTQRFNLNWAEIHSKTVSELESVVGRCQYTDELVPSFDTRSHIRSSHTYDETGNTIKLLRIGLPFGTRGRVDKGTPLIENAGGSARNDEAGIYFIAMARSAGRIETILNAQFGKAGSDGFGPDRLLNSGIAKSDLGGFFYAPSIRELGAEAFVDDAKRRGKTLLLDWQRFPGIDWSRLNRHYKKRSTNGWMFYNHQDYLYSLGTYVNDSDTDPKPPSIRVQFLLERLFSKWDDTWFRPQKPNELAPLRTQLERFFSNSVNHAERDALLRESGLTQFDNNDAKRAAELIMKQPVAIRAAWAGRLICNLVGRLDGVGQRGNGGMDTCDIHPLDLLAGSMPAQSLAEGRYFIDYAQDDDDEAERYSWYTKGLGPNSGVGHVVPSYEEILVGGIAAVDARIDETEASLTASDPGRAANSKQFYVSSRLALKGVAEYLDALADTVAAKAATLPAIGLEIERTNLNALEERLRWLSTGQAPRTVLEALQIILACHITLHICGEPVAVGRLDRLIRPFQEMAPLSEDELQEAIDCFWLKLGEKVLLNRIFIDDRQELGNLAMGNRAGPYPKGQSVNQWIQQLTVGGRNADGTWEYSDVTLACIRASARLPFNAPVLSLRVSKDMPHVWRKRLMKEAAQAQLSGGACPILLNDDKIIPGLAQSGDGIGPSQDSVNAKLWNSRVRIEDAHDYACDGCYEPQFVGANWFHLGGTVLLQPLEHALNQGRQMQSAGPVDLLGKNMSFRSPSASEIDSYDKLETLFFKHFEWSYARQLESTLADFGRMQSVCPAPMLNLFINDCLTKGQDIYAGGARYNVLGPCFTSLANTINALWAIRTMCFDETTALTTLPELVQALLCNWGESMIDPLIHPTMLATDQNRVAETAERFRHLRKIALSLPRWGRGQPDIDAFGNEICNRISQIAVEAMTRPRPSLAAQYDRLATLFGSEHYPFGGFCMQPGVGTFASYVEQGLGCAASADGRLSGQPLATDMSPTPTPVDLPAIPATKQVSDGIKVLLGMRSANSFGFSNGAPIDLNVAEDIGVERLVEILEAFTEGAGSNILTITVANQETFLAAASSPEAYDLLRVRMGGWTEMFVAMHALHQKVHPRRPVSV